MTAVDRCDRCDGPIRGVQPYAVFSIDAPFQSFCSDACMCGWAAERCPQAYIDALGLAHAAVLAEHLRTDTDLCEEGARHAHQ